MIQLTIIILCFAGYLQPFHSAPWPSIINDGLFVLLGFLLIFDSIHRSKKYAFNLAVKEIILIISLTAYLLTTAYINNNNGFYPYLIALISSYLCYKTSINNKLLLNYLIIGIWLSSAATAILGIGQWLGTWEQFAGRFVWMTDVDPGTRLSGNLAQANNAGTLLIWGLLCGLVIAGRIDSLALHERSKAMIHGLMTSSMLLITIASALTQSRTTTLSFFIVSAITWKFRQICSKRVLQTILVACFINVAIALFLPLINTFLFDAKLTAAYGGRGLASDARLTAYDIFLNAILQKPFFGYGIGGTTTAFVEGIQKNTDLGVYFGHTHNIIIDLFVWLGIPVGLLIIFLIARFYFRAWNKITSLDHLLIFLIISVAIIHSMLEYPLSYAYFLIPFSLFSGQFSSFSNPDYAIHKNLIGVLLASLLTLFIACGIDYFRLERDIRQSRVDIAITGKSHPIEKPEIVLLDELENANYVLRLDIKSDMNSTQLAILDKTAFQFPMKFYILKNIEALNFNNQMERAEFWRKKYCHIYGGKDC